MSWQQYWSILQEMHDEATFETSCPVCGEPLDVNNRGVANCPRGNWRGTLNGKGEAIPTMANPGG